MIYNWIKFNEARVKDGRKPFNTTGAYKEVYISETNPNIVIKTFDKSLIPYVQWEEDFCMDYPNLYAYIYKVDYKKCIMIQELLDNKKVFEEMSILHKCLKLGFYDISYTLRYMKYIINEKNKIKSIKEKLGLVELKIFNRWITFLKKLNAIDPNYYTDEGFLDSHINNIGYDKKGRLKLLDL